MRSAPGLERKIAMTEHIQLAPGVNLWVLQSHKFKTACFSVNFLNRHDRHNAPLDALFPSVLLSGTEHYPDIRSISARMDELYGASFGTLVRRKGEVKLTGFYAEFIEDEFLPAGEHLLEDTVDFLREVLYAPLTENGCFCERFVTREKENLINAIEAEINDKRSYAAGRLLGEMCEKEPYGIPRLGYVEDAEEITPQRLWAHYRKILSQAPVEIFYAGRKSAQQVAQCFAGLFDGQQERKCAKELQTPFVAKAENCRELEERMDVTQGKLVMGLRTGIAVTDPEYPALMLLNVVFGGGMTSKLFVNVREKRSLCYYASSSLEKYKGLMLISCGVDFDKYEEAKQAILFELEECRRGNITEEELSTAKLQTVSSLRISQDAPAQLDDFYCGRAVYGGSDLPELIERVQTLGVKELSDAAKRLSLDTIYFLKGETA